MKPPKTRAYFRCSQCHEQTGLWVSLRDFDAAEYACEHCGAFNWVPLESLQTTEGQRLISHRPFEERPVDLE